MKRKPFQPVLIGQHIAKCYAIKCHRRGDWQTPWAYIRELVYRDSMGRKHAQGRHRWWLVGCNCSECPARILVSENQILGSLPPGRIERSSKQRDSQP